MLPYPPERVLAVESFYCCLFLYLDSLRFYTFQGVAVVNTLGKPTENQYEAIFLILQFIIVSMNYELTLFHFVFSLFLTENDGTDTEM